MAPGSHNGPPRVPRSRATPSCQTKALFRLNSPATWPAALMPRARLGKPRSVIAPFCQRKASSAPSPAICDVPATWPAALMPLAEPLLPPSVPRSRIPPFSQRKGCQVLLSVRVEEPTIWPASLRPAAVLWAPPSVPRSVIPPSCQRKACQVVLSGVSVIVPSTWPRLLMALALLDTPPSTTAARCLRSEEHTSELQSPDQLVCR